MKILITGVGGPTPRSFARAVRQSDSSLAKKIHFTGVDCNPLAYGLYDKSLFDSFHLVPRADDPEYWPAINEVIRKDEIEAAVIMPEEEVLEWAKNRSKLERAVKTHLPEHLLATTLVNKHRLHKILEGSPSVPKYRKIDPASYDYGQLTDLVGNRFWIRSTEGSSGLGSLRIESEASLAQWVSLNGGVKEFLATEYLPGRNMACKLLYFDGELKRTACAERVNYIMAKVAPSGITGNTSFGRLINEPGLVKISEETLDKIASGLGTGLNGIFTVDFKEDVHGEPKITEINIRHVAFTSSLAAGGANLPLDTVEAMFSEGRSAMKRIDYTYDEPLIFLRDVDSLPVVMREEDLLGEGGRE